MFMGVFDGDLGRRSAISFEVSPVLVYFMGVVKISCGIFMGDLTFERFGCQNLVGDYHGEFAFQRFPP